MKFLADQIVTTAQEAKDLAVRLVGGGVDFLRSTVGSLPLFAGTRVYEAADDLAEDETHYFLIPLLTAPGGCAVSVQRVIPTGHGLENDLPKRRIFHLPSTGARERLEAMLTANLTRENLARTADETHSDFADRLDRIADEIDRQSDKVTGGLLIIGGAVAIANPLLGVAIAAKAIFPSLGSKITKEALKFVGEKFRASAKQSVRDAAEKKAASEVQRLEPSIFTDPLLAVLDVALAAEDPLHDPHAETPPVGEAPGAKRLRELTARAISQCYADILAMPDPPPEAKLDGADIAWLRWLSRQGGGK